MIFPSGIYLSRSVNTKDWVDKRTGESLAYSAPWAWSTLLLLLLTSGLLLSPDFTDFNCLDLILSQKPTLPRLGFQPQWELCPFWRRSELSEQYWHSHSLTHLGRCLGTLQLWKKVPILVVSWPKWPHPHAPRDGLIHCWDPPKFSCWLVVHIWIR